MRVPGLFGRSAALAVVVWSLGCATKPGPGPDAGPTADAGPELDAGPSDAGLPPDAGPTVGRRVSFTPPVDDDPASLPLPKNDAGVMLLTPGAPVELGWVPPTPGPMTALAHCVRWISTCFSPPDRTLDDCARSVPVCQTAQPWNEPTCCPQTCFERYATLRLAGTDLEPAMAQAYFDRADNCVPGVSQLLKVTP